MPSWDINQNVFQRSVCFVFPLLLWLAGATIKRKITLLLKVYSENIVLFTIFSSHITEWSQIRYYLACPQLAFSNPRNPTQQRPWGDLPSQWQKVNYASYLHGDLQFTKYLHTHCFLWYSNPLCEATVTLIPLMRKWGEGVVEVTVT